MSTALTIISAPPPLPVMPPELAQKCATFDGMDLIRGTVPARVVEQARAHLAALEAYHRPAPSALIELWCRKLRGGMAPLGEADFIGRLEAIQSSCGELPAWVWTSETHKLAWRRFKFFPTAHEMFEFLDEIAQKGMRGLSQVRMLANAKPSLANQGMATPEQIEFMRQRLGVRDAN